MARSELSTLFAVVLVIAVTVKADGQRGLPAASATFGLSVEAGYVEWANTAATLLSEENARGWKVCTLVLASALLMGFLYGPRMNIVYFIATVLFAVLVLVFTEPYCEMHPTYDELEEQLAALREASESSTARIQDDFSKALKEQAAAMERKFERTHSEWSEKLQTVESKAFAMEQRLHSEWSEKLETVESNLTGVSSSLAEALHQIQELLNASDESTQCELCVEAGGWDGACTNGQCSCGTVCTSLDQWSGEVVNDSDNKKGGCTYRYKLRCW